MALTLSTSAFADWTLQNDNGDWQDCGPAKVDAVRVEHGAIFTLLNNKENHWKAWKRIALSRSNYNYIDNPVQLSVTANNSKPMTQQQKNLRFNTEMESSQFQSLLENALLRNKTVTVRFTGPEVCNTDNWSSNAVMIQLNR
ncbi:hypothetical protein [Photobacterium iliopiscarium]|nr:hypothetical protein [Photobacterium iliopiscarium]